MNFAFCVLKSFSVFAMIRAMCANLKFHHSVVRRINLPALHTSGVLEIKDKDKEALFYVTYLKQTT